MDDSSWFANSMQDAGPSLEDFLASDPSELPFLQERPATTEDFLRYQIFADEWGSIEHLQQVCDFVVSTTSITYDTKRPARLNFVFCWRKAGSGQRRWCWRLLF